MNNKLENILYRPFYELVLEERLSEKIKKKRLRRAKLKGIWRGIKRNIEYTEGWMYEINHDKEFAGILAKTEREYMYKSREKVWGSIFNYFAEMSFLIYKLLRE